MTVVCKRIQITTNGLGDTINVTSDIAREVNNTGIINGIVTVFLPGSTAGITTIEYEPGLMTDIHAMWDRLIPANLNYEHDKAWGDGNGNSHVRSALLGPSVTIPFVNKRLTLGTWQQVVVIDFDIRPRSREIILQLIGE
jgi:secondary thiamine-phosphate synthase enzyme